MHAHGLIQSTSATIIPVEAVDSQYATAYAVFMSPVYVRLKELRLALGLTQAELATRAGIRRATVSRLENAQVTAINLKVLEKLADVLGVDPGFLFRRTPGADGASGRQRSRPRRSLPPDG